MKRHLCFVNAQILGAVVRRGKNKGMIPYDIPLLSRTPLPAPSHDLSDSSNEFRAVDSFDASSPRFV